MKGTMNRGRWWLFILLGNCLLQMISCGIIPDEHVADADKTNPRHVVFPVRLNSDGTQYEDQSSHFLKRRRRSTTFSSFEKPTKTGNPAIHEERHYSFNAFDRQMEIQLQHDADFLAPNLVIERIGANQSEMWIREGDNRHCFYTGKVKGDPWSRVSVSVCDHMMGSIFAFAEHFLIEAHPNVTSQSLDQSDDELVPHIIYRANDQYKPAEKLGSDTVDTDDIGNPDKYHNNNENNERRRNPRRGKSRQKRGSGNVWSTGGEENYVELMIAVDTAMERFHGDDLDHYILVLMSLVANVYKNHTLENNVNIVVKRVVLLGSEDAGPRVTTSAASTLRNFCIWQNEANVERETSPLHHDTAVLITKKNICRNTKSCETLGLAETGTMCDSERSCAIAEDNGLSTAFTIAHELGHVFSLPHDDERRCKKYPGTARGEYHVMASTLDYTTNPWSWSDCSAAEMTAFLHSPEAHCLHNNPHQSEYRYYGESKGQRSEQPGELYGVDSQCEQAYGQGSKLCPYTHDMYNEIHKNDLLCTRLWCTNVGPNGDSVGCRTQHMPWADGTRCGNHMWCIMGQCVRRRRLVSSDGGWSEWMNYGECSRTCGGGVKKSYRKCNNPPPKHGGKFCKGDSVRYVSCNTQECFGHGRADTFRDDQCSKFNGNNLNVINVSRDVKWKPMYTNIPQDGRCKLFCQADNNSAFYFALEPKVIDGTKCDPDSSDICVNGVCVPAGCDNVLGSKNQRDQCGVCDGDGSTCRLVKKSYNPRLTSSRYGYNKVDDIPKGASNIRIEQHGYRNGSTDSNYLALMDARGNFLLNGNFSVSAYKKRIHVKGTVLDYSGSGALVEVITGTRKIEENIVLMLLTVEDMHPPDITYSFTITRDINYRWAKRNIQCKSKCGVGRQKVAKCIRFPDRQMVDDRYCEELRLPKPSYNGGNCSDDCTLSWKMVFQTNCSARCGAGFVKRQYKCYRIDPRFNAPAQVVIPSECDFHVGPQPQEKWPCNSLCLTPEWVFADWSSCTKTCGGGYQYRRATCKDSQGKIRHDSECEDSRRKLIQRCNLEECPQWLTSEWSSCSASCGNGVQERHLWCKQGDKTVSKTLCASLEQPIRSQACSADSCAEWREGRWGDCQTTCGRSIKRRDVRCVSQSGIQVDEGECDKESKPVDYDICYQEACTTVTSSFTSTTTVATQAASSATTARQTAANRRSLFYQPTTSTSLTNTKIQTASRTAAQPDTRSRVSSTSPRTSARTSVIQTAARTDTRSKAKVYASWRTGSWTACSVTCGTGIHHRYVSCRDYRGESMDHSACGNEPKPVNREYCTMPACGRWRTGDWRPCPVQCGGGKTTRFVACVIQTEFQEAMSTSTSQCDIKVKPDVEQLCNTHECEGPDKYVIDSISTNRVERTAHWRVGIWGGCSVTCGGGWQRRAVACMDERGKSVDCDPAQQPKDMQQCNQQLCPIWRSGDWGQCSQSCNGGTQHRQVVCQYPSGGQHLDAAECDFISRPGGSRTCNNHKCNRSSQDKHRRRHENSNEASSTARWYKGPWSQCSITCGKGGVKTRQVTCKEKHTAVVVDEIQCSNKTKPKSTRRCRGEVCPKWKTSKWSQCSAQCGEGVMTRNIQCVGAKRKTLAPSLCSHIPQPNNSISCVTPCDKQHSFVWRADQWSKCSANCGPGERKRTLHCIALQTNQTVNNSNCNMKNKPGDRRKCIAKPCQFMWMASEWSQCSKSCDRGIQTRTIKCHESSPEGWIISDNSGGCDNSTIPTQQRKCMLARCGSPYMWREKPWQECQSECGLGIQSRALECVNAQQNVVSGRRCSRRFKPVRSQLCYSKPCYASSCKDLQTKSSIREDGEYNLLIQENLVSVYCHNMHRSQPKEYLTLASNNGNYAIVFHKRLKDPSMCPEDTCSDCFSESIYTKSGHTSFSRVRLNITSLHIIVSDLQFSRSRSSYKRIPYGQAGDCYSQASCPQGHFKIDLSDTPFRIAPEARWVATGRNTTMKIHLSQDKQQVEGRCGGLCGNCMPQGGVLPLELFFPT